MNDTTPCDDSRVVRLDFAALRADVAEYLRECPNNAIQYIGENIVPITLGFVLAAVTTRSSRAQ